MRGPRSGQWGPVQRVVGPDQTVQQTHHTLHPVTLLAPCPLAQAHRHRGREALGVHAAHHDPKARTQAKALKPSIPTRRRSCQRAHKGRAPHQLRMSTPTPELDAPHAASAEEHTQSPCQAYIRMNTWMCPPTPAAWRLSTQRSSPISVRFAATGSTTAPGRSQSPKASLESTGRGAAHAQARPAPRRPCQGEGWAESPAAYAVEPQRTPRRRS